MAEYRYASRQTGIRLMVTVNVSMSLCCDVAGHKETPWRVLPLR